VQTKSRLRSAAPTALLLVIGTLAAILAACGGYSSGNSMGSSASGCGGAYGGGMCAAPIITANAPVAAGATVNRTVTLTAAVTVASGLTVMRVEFLIDDASVGSVTGAPYQVSWDSTTVSDGTHAFTASVTDSSGQTTTSAAVSIKVLNTPSFTVSLSPAQIFPAPASSATGTAALTVKLANGAVSGKVTLSGVNATGVSINGAFAGTTGAAAITLAANGSVSGEWDVPADAILTSDQITALLQGGLYVLASSAANPNGELRGQIAPGNVQVVFTQLSGSQEVPPVSGSASGMAAVTVNSEADTLSAEVNLDGVTDATAAGIYTAAAGASGPQLLELKQNSANPAQWGAQLANITATDLSNFQANKLYVNVLTATDPAGAVRGQIDATATSAPPAATPTLTQLTSTVFQVCGSCHTGGGSSLPQSMNLTPGHIYASIVNVASVEQPSLLRVKPGDPANSYVVQKLEGAPTISGARMPFGGPYESQAMIDQLEAWISAGAPNN
jgi:CHRD domain/Bacterial Ig domain